MIGFRVDANETIATGHLMRCITIAEQCGKQGEACIFFLAEKKETERLEQKNIPYRILNSNWEDMESELPAMETLLNEEKLDWLVVDSYQATADYLAVLESRLPVLYIDDMEKETYPVSAVLHYINWEQDKRYEQRYRNTTAKVLTGMRYAPLREEFSETRKNKKREKSILITTGGTDTYNIASRILEYCQNRVVFETYQFEVIVGNMNSHEKQLLQMAEKNPRIRLHKNISNISDYMKRCEVAVSAGGTTLLELCACCIPTVCFSFAQNQMAFASEMGQQKVMCYAGDARFNASIEKAICEQLLSFMQNEDNRSVYAQKMGQLVDGKGATRIAELLCQK